MAPSTPSDTDPPPPRPVPPKKSGRGGRRKGAGRKQSRLPPAVVKRIGPPPLDSPLQMVRWWGKLLGELAWLRIEGRVHKALVDDVRALSAAAKGMIPDELRAEVDRLLRENDNAKKNGGAAQGPAVEEQPRDQQQTLRRDPR